MSGIFEVKKDTERTDEIRAMKQAWEMTEPGRSVKVVSLKNCPLPFIPGCGLKEEPY